VISLKKKSIIVFLIIIIIVIGVGIVVFLYLQPSGNYEYSVQNAFPNLTFNTPVGIYDPGDGTNRLFVVEQDGRIKVFENDANTNTSQIFLDLTVDVISGGEQGLLGLAFHPDYDMNGYFYVYYTETGTGDSIISRFKVDDINPNLGNKSSEALILKIVQPFPNHNAGQIHFGPGGYLYIALGDGGGDGGGHAQNRQSLLGSILRIDVNSTFPYDIPNNNPFVGNINGWKEEIFAFGFRNPWRFSIDPVTGFLWVGDVGQNSWEEIDIVEKGKNYGWSTKEGSHEYNPGTNVTKVEDPVYEYPHTLGNVITGGYVYRGSTLTDLIGKYIYADFGSGRIWALEYAGGVVVKNKELFDASLNIPSFGVDANNELYICAFDGNIYKLIQL